MTSAILWTPAANRAAADMIGTALGWGDASYTIDLSADGGASVTHAACRADVSPAFIAMFAAAAGGTYPPGLPEALHPAIAAIEADFSDTLWGAEHLAAVLAAHGLERV